VGGVIPSIQKKAEVLSESEWAAISYPPHPSLPLPNGEIKWQGALIYVSAVFAHEPVGLTQVADQQWETPYSVQRLGLLDQRLKRILPATG
jgi:hypothetical protein